MYYGVGCIDDNVLLQYLLFRSFVQEVEVNDDYETNREEETKS